MITTLCLLLALVSAGLLTEMIAASPAPYGYEDDAGFHFGSEEEARTVQGYYENPS